MCVKVKVVLTLQLSVSVNVCDSHRAEGCVGQVGNFKIFDADP